VGSNTPGQVCVASSVIEHIATEDGFLLNSWGTYSYYYHLTDHLGNVRVVLNKDVTAAAPVDTSF